MSKNPWRPTVQSWIHPGRPQGTLCLKGGKKLQIFGSVSLLLEDREKMIPTQFREISKWNRTLLTLSRVWPFQEKKGIYMWHAGGGQGVSEFYGTWFQTFALLSSREIKDKTLYEIFITPIPFSLPQMTIETLHGWIISQEPVTTEGEKSRRRLTQRGKMREREDGEKDVGRGRGGRKC